MKQMSKTWGFLAALALLAVLCAVSSGEGLPEASASLPGTVTISFAYEKQSGYASNQFAVWIEDMEGNLVKTLYATRFTAAGGYKNRPDSLPAWAAKAGLASMHKAEVDAVSGATPKAGLLSFAWDLTDENGGAVPPGEYRFFVEGSLRWKNRVLYSGVIDTSGAAAAMQASAEYFYEASNGQPALSGESPENAMIGAVTATWQPDETNGGESMARLYYQGHGSFRLTSGDGVVVYVDPYAGEGYDLPADIILVTHQHGDHNQINLPARKEDCTVITQAEALAGGAYQAFSAKGIEIEAVAAGNQNHDPRNCVGYIITIDGIKLYAAGDTSTTEQMASFAEKGLSYALLPCDGVYNMDLEEAAACAETIGAKHNIPIHMKPGALFDRERAEGFGAPNRLIVEPGEEIILEK